MKKLVSLILSFGALLLLSIGLFSTTSQAETERSILNLKRAECGNPTSSNFIKMNVSKQIVRAQLNPYKFLTNSPVEGSKFEVKYYQNIFNTTFSGAGAMVIDQYSKTVGNVFLVADTNRLLNSDIETLLALYTDSEGNAQQDAMNCKVWF